MLKKNILATTTFYSCINHTDNLIEKYFNELEIVFKLISDCELGNCEVKDLLDGPICHAGFERLN